MTATTDASFRSPIFKKNFKMIIASNRHLASIKAVKVQESSELEAGQILARDPGDGLHKKWSSISGSTNDTACALLFDLSENEATGTSIVRAVFAGELFEDDLVELDSNAKTKMGAVSQVDGKGTKILKF